MILLLILGIIIVWAIFKTLSAITAAVLICGLIIVVVAAVIFDKLAENNEKYRAAKRAWNEMDENQRYAIKVAAFLVAVFSLIYIGFELLAFI